jgi:hypothetical protein
VAGSCEHGNEPSGSIKGGKFLDWLSDYQLLKKDCSLELVRLPKQIVDLQIRIQICISFILFF